MNETEFTTFIKRKVRIHTTESFDDDDFADAIDSAERETGFTLPVTDSNKLLWLEKRAVYWLINSLILEKAEDFQVKQIHLEQPFKHYMQLLNKWDWEFRSALENDPVLALGGLETYHFFGKKLDSGFAYDEFGRDLTYDDDIKPPVKPENS